MTKKHFRALAQRFYNIKGLCVTQEEMNTLGYAIKAVADVCAEINPRFRREQFLFACENGLSAKKESETA